MKRATPSSHKSSGSKRRTLGSGSSPVAGKDSPFDLLYTPQGPLDLAGRKEQADCLLKNLEHGRTRGEGTTIYCFGPPGTGKTLTVESVAGEFCTQHDIPLVSLNCITDGPPATIMRRIYTGILDVLHIPNGKKAPGHDCVKPLDRVRKLVESLTSPVVLLLDEIDALNRTTGEKNVLRQVWSIPGVGPLLLISVANTFDLLTQHMEHIPVTIKSIKFPVYEENQCLEILQRRAHDVGQPGQDLLAHFKPQALLVLIKKVMNAEGDFRRVLHLCAELNRSQRMVQIDNVLPVLQKTLTSNLFNDVPASIKRISLAAKVVLYCFTQPLTSLNKAKQKKTNPDAEVYPQLDIEEIKLRFQSTAKKFVTKTPILATLGLQDALNVEAAKKDILANLINEGLIEKKIPGGIRAKKKVQMEFYRLQYPVDEVKKFLGEDITAYIVQHYS